MANQPTTTPNPNLTSMTADDHMHVMQEMFCLPSQQFMQMLQQVIQITQTPPSQVPAPALQPLT